MNSKYTFHAFFCAKWFEKYVMNTGNVALFVQYLSSMHEALVIDIYASPLSTPA